MYKTENDGTVQAWRCPQCGHEETQALVDWYGKKCPSCFIPMTSIALREKDK